MLWEAFADRRPSLVLSGPLARLAASALLPSTSERGRRSGSEGRDRLTHQPFLPKTASRRNVAAGQRAGIG